MNQPENEDMGLFKGAGHRGIWQAWAILLVGLIATALVAHYTKSAVDGEAKREFDFGCQEIRSKILDRLSAHEQILRSGAAFYVHSGGVSRLEWRRFTERQKVEQQLPGIQGIGFALLIPRQKLAQHVQEIRSEGFPAYDVRPKGEREIYSSILYLEPFANRNLRAFGYDMLSEPVRRMAMERARDQDTAALSGKVILVQETDQDVQAGTLMYVPVYRTGMPHDTVAQRRDALVGWVYSPYRMNDLLQGILGGWDLEGQKRIHLEIFDSDQVSSQTLLYDSQSAGNRELGSASGLTLQSRVVSSGRQWTLRFTRHGNQAATMDYGKVWLVLFGGTSTSLLLSGLFFSLLNTRFKAWQMARQLTTELRQSEERYRSLLDDMLDGFAFCRMVFDDQARPVDFIYLNVNSAFEQLTGLRNVVGIPVTEVIPNIKETNPEFFEIYGRVVLTGKPEKMEIYVKTLARWLTISVTSAGKGCFAVIFDDISARKQAEDALQQAHDELEQRVAARTEELQQANEELRTEINERKRAEGALRVALVKYQTLFNSFPLGLTVSDEAGKILESNQMAARLLGEPQEKHIQRGIDSPEWRIVRPDGTAMPSSEYASVRALREKRTVESLEMGIVKPDHKITWISVTAAPLPLEGYGVAITYSDITERKQAEQALIKANERWEALLESISDAFFALDEQLVITYYNRAAERMLGRAQKEVLGRPLFEAFPEARGSIFETNYRKALAARQFMAFEAYFNMPPLENWYDVRVYPSHEGIAVYFQITTERKQAEAEREKLEAQNRQLQKSESLGRMAGAIAHHFNNQLQAVMMNLKLAMIDLPQTAVSVEFLTEAMQSVHKAAEVSSLMLTYLGQTVAKCEPLGLSEICLQSLPMLRASIPNSVVLESDLPSPGPAINANRNQVQQVLTNLVTNAWEANGDRRGAIRLTGKTVSVADIPTAHRFPIDWQPRDNAYACLEVADSGSGIPDQDIEKIFDPFFSTKFTGRGMGLSVVLGIVRAHNGVVTVESKPGQGSVFRVFLPVSAEAVPPKPVPVAQAPKFEKGGAILLVEDEPSLRRVVALALERLDFTVLAAADGVEAVELFRQHRGEIRCVLSDLTMPRMNGWETLTALRQLAPGIPVILASGYSEAQVMEGSHPELPQAFLSKPYEQESLVNAISQVLANQKK